jgi:hypothetical protein
MVVLEATTEGGAAAPVVAEGAPSERSVASNCRLELRLLQHVYVERALCACNLYGHYPRPGAAACATTAYILSLPPCKPVCLGPWHVVRFDGPWLAQAPLDFLR